MGTRGAIGFRSNETDYIAYNQSDSYPNYLGDQMLKFVAAQYEEHGNGMVAAMRKAVSELMPVSNEKKPTRLQKSALARWTSTNVSEGKDDDWYCLLRGAQGDPAAMLKARYYMDCADFLIDGLFCEYAYIVNLDTEMLEFYSGFVDPAKAAYTPPGRYWPLMGTAGVASTKYGPVVLTDEIPLKLMRMTSRHKSLVTRLDKGIAKLRKELLGVKKLDMAT